MSKDNALLIDCQYLPNCSWFSAIAKHDVIYLDKKEHYVKASYRNRAHILSPNGVLRLTVPILKGQPPHSKMDEVPIAYNDNWQKIHWQTLCSCYRRSAYFEYFEDDLVQFYSTRYEKLFDLNFALIQFIMKALKWQKEFKFTEHYIEPLTEGFTDMRSVITPKISAQNLNVPKYTQVFSDRFEFKKDLSIIDLICNGGKIKI